MTRTLTSCATLFFVLVALSTVAFAQASTIDSTFAPVPSKGFGNDDISNKGILALPDGRSIIWGGNLAVDGKAKGGVARLNTDGTVDNSFTYCSCLESLTNVLIQADGRVLVAGSSFNQAKVVRLNTDGSQDLTFGSVFNGLQALASYAELITVLGDGRILVNITGYYAGGFHGRYVTRLQTGGSTDSGFSNIVYDGGRLINTYLRALTVDPNSGKLYLAYTTFSGPTQSSSLSRANADGTNDATWERPSFAPSDSYYTSLTVQADGGLLIGGRFDTVNGLSKTHIVRLAPAGNVDMTFTAPALGTAAGQVQLLQSGKLLVTYNAAGVNQLVRLNSDGSLDNTFTLSSSVNGISTRWALDQSERIYFLGVSELAAYRYFRLNANGDLDASFNPNVTLFGQITALAAAADGKFVLTGNFTQVNGIRRPSIARVNGDGTLDPTFAPDNGFSSPPFQLAVQPDGKTIAVGQFTSYNGMARNAIVRINTDGTLDTGFVTSIPDFQVVNDVFLRSDGKMFIAGSFTGVNGSVRTGIALLNADGTLDNSFNPTFGSPNLTTVFQQADNKVMVGGSFSGVNGFNRSGVVRLNADGSLDQTFNATGVGGVAKVWRQSDGKYIISNVSSLSRRNVDGTADASFVGPAFDTTGSNGREITQVVIQPDGSLLVAGRFDIVGGAAKRNLVRLSSTGGVDPLFAPTGADAPVRAMLRQADGKIVIGGEFTKVETVTRAGVARMSVSEFRNATPFDFDGDGRADVAVYRPSSGVWYQLFSGGGGYGSPTFGLPSDIAAPADYDGDGKTDLAIYRPSTGTWWYTASATGQLRAVNQGTAEDIPLPSDVNGDGTDDFVLFRPSTNTWVRVTTGGTFSSMIFGIAGDRPLIGDFDGDGKADPAVFRPSTGDWWYAASSQFNVHRQFHWGQTGDIAAPADFDGDGKTDFAVYRPSNGGWYIFRSSDLTYTIRAFGIDGDRPAPADYDGDGKADIAVFRPSTGVWYLFQSTAGTAGIAWGVSTDVAVPNAFVRP